MNGKPSALSRGAQLFAGLRLQVAPTATVDLEGSAISRLLLSQ